MSDIKLLLHTNTAVFSKDQNDERRSHGRGVFMKKLTHTDDAGIYIPAVCDSTQSNTPARETH